MYVRICCNVCTFFYFQVSVFDGTYDIRTPQTDFTVITVQDDEDRPMRSYTLGELKPSAFYQVEVRARNDIGWSIPNPEFVFSTAEGTWFYPSWDLVTQWHLNRIADISQVTF